MRPSSNTVIHWLEIEENPPLAHLLKIINQAMCQAAHSASKALQNSFRLEENAETKRSGRNAAKAFVRRQFFTRSNASDPNMTTLG